MGFPKDKGAIHWGALGGKILRILTIRWWSRGDLLPKSLICVPRTLKPWLNLNTNLWSEKRMFFKESKKECFHQVTNRQWLRILSRAKSRLRRYDPKSSPYSPRRKLCSSRRTKRVGLQKMLYPARFTLLETWIPFLRLKSFTNLINVKSKSY